MERLLPLEGCLNFRDLGGYPTRDGRRVAWRRLFRSDALHDLTETDLSLLLGVDVGLSDVIDLRSSAELERDGRGRLERVEVAFHHSPLYDASPGEPREAPADMTLADRYIGLLEVAQGAVARIMGVLASAEGAAVYHCAAGKDRTGVVSALVLGVLGVDDELIVADYALTQQNLDAIIDRLSTMKGYADMRDVLPPDTLHANPETMTALVEGVQGRYGGWLGYLAEAGVTDDTVQQLRGRLLEPSG